jgi:hypothetical protein
MKYLKRFNSINESKKSEYELKDSTIDKIKELSKISNEDIIYYFSEFTDDCEYEYFSYTKYVSDIEEDIFENGGTIVIIEFKKKYSGSKIDSVIQMGKDLEKFKNCLHQFKELGEDDGFKYKDDDVNIERNEINIEIKLIRILPEFEQIKSEYYQELEQIKNSHKSISFRKYLNTAFKKK